MKCFGLFLVDMLMGFYRAQGVTRTQDAQSEDLKYTHSAHWYFIQLYQF